MPKIYTTMLEVNPEWNDYDRSLVNPHLKKYGMVILDENGFPVRDRKEAEERYCNLSNQILGNLSDAQLDYCAELGDRISRRLPQYGALEHVQHEILDAQLTGYLDSVAMEKDISGKEKEWLHWYFSQKDRSGEIIDLKHERKL